MTTRWLRGLLPCETAARYGLGATIVILAGFAGMLYAAQASSQAGERAQEAAAARANPRISRVASDTSKPKNAKGHSGQNKAASPSNGYAGAEACSRCHAEIYNHFTHTTMGRSTRAVTPELIKTLPFSQPVYDAKFDRHYEVTSRDGKFYQSEFQVDAAGKEVFRDTHPVEWIIGTGPNGLGGLIQRDGYLFQAPLSYYPLRRVWDISPGYQRGDYGFSRLIAPGCIYCHTGRSEPVAGAMGKYENKPFTQTAIGCENCHGPGSAHIEAMQNGESYVKGKDPTVVNPASLTTALADDICMSCHQTGDARVFQPGKTYRDFRPGTPLNRVMAILMIPPTREKLPNADHAQHYNSMILSKCFRASEDKPASKQMRCITCHDPHIEPTAAEAPAFFNGKCVSCHTSASCTASKEARSATSPADNCIGCHMPKHENPTLTHSSITNHRIVTRPDEPYPDAAFEQTTEDLPDLIYMNRARGDHSPIPGIALLGAYDQLREQWPEYNAAWLRTLNQLERSDSDNAVTQASLGHRDLLDGRVDDAAGHLQRSIQLDEAQPAVYADLSAIADQKGQAEEAVALAQKAVTLDPFNAAPRKILVLRLINSKRYDEAMAAMEKDLEIFPEDDFMRKMLAIAKQ